MKEFANKLTAIFTSKQNLIVVAILLIAAALRLYMIGDYMIFLGDEGRDALTAYNILHGHFTLLGPTASVGGFFYGPLYFYLIAPFLWVFRYDPVGPAIMVALFGTATTYLVYRLTAKFYDTTTAVLATFLYATNAYTILFSRSSWNPHLVPFFVILTALTLLHAVETQKKWLYVLAGFWYGLVFELHYVTLFFAVAMVIFMFLTTGQKNPLAIIRSFIMRIALWAVGFLVGISPILAFEVRHQFVNTRNLFQFIFFSKETGGGNQVIPTIFDTFVRIFTRGVFGFPQPSDFKNYSAQILFIWNWAPVALGVGAVILLFRQWQKTTDAHVRTKRLMTLLWIGCGVLLFGLYKKNIYEYYFEMLFPISTMLIASLGVLIARKGRLQAFLVGIGILLTLVCNITQYPFKYPPNEQVSQTKVIAKEVLRLAENKPYNFALITGGNSDHAYRYFLTLFGNPPVTINNADIDPQRKTVTDQLIVVCESLPCAPLGFPLWEVAGFGRADIVSRTPLSVVEIDKLVHYRGGL